MAIQNGLSCIFSFLLISSSFKGIILKPGISYLTKGKKKNSLLSIQVAALGVEIRPTTQKKMVTNIQEKQDFRAKGHHNSLLVWKMNKNERRLMIGSTAPICTYNECRGCRFKCRTEQIPVSADDPINSAYHYRCVCYG